MADWPTTIPIPEGITEDIQKSMESSSSSNGFISFSKENTITIKVYTLSWEMLTSAQKEILITFFSENMGGNFSWLHPISDITYTVTFGDDSVIFKYIGIDGDGVGYYSSSITFITHDTIFPLYDYIYDDSGTRIDDDLGIPITIEIA